MKNLIQPDISPLPRNRYILDNDFEYVWISKGITYKIIVPKNFIYDGASIPRFLWSISGIMPDGIHRAASLIHDYIYHFEGRMPKNTLYLSDGENNWVEYRNKISRKDCDMLFYVMLKEYKVNLIRSNLMYYIVRVFGYFFWMEI